jgi:hypothetical protein
MAAACFHWPVLLVEAGTAIWTQQGLLIFGEEKVQDCVLLFIRHYFLFTS